MRGQLPTDLYATMVLEVRAHAIFFIDPEGVLGSWNAGVQRALGYAAEEFVGRRAQLIFTPEDRALGVPEAELARSAAAGEASDNRWHLRKDGSRLWCNGVVTALREPGGTLIGYVKIMRDNTREKLADEALRRSYAALERQAEERSRELLELSEHLKSQEASFSGLLQAGPFAAVLLTPDAERVLEVNAAFTRLSGYAREEALGKSVRELGWWATPEDRAALRRAVGEGGAFRELALSLRTKAGDFRSVLCSSVPSLHQGEPALLRVLYDVTEQRRTQEELMRAIEEVMRDTSWFSREVVERLARRRGAGEVGSEVAALTPRERQVLGLVAQGLSDKQIAKALGLALQTVRNYVSSIYGKVGVHARAEAVVWARERGVF